MKISKKLCPIVMFNMYEFIKNKKTKEKIDDLARFILNPQYQKIRGVYGWIWSFTEKTYHACGPGICLPLFNNDDLGRDEWSFLNIMETMSLSPVMQESEWFKKCIYYLERYKTEKGTYLFPDGFFNHLTYHTPAGVNALCDDHKNIIQFLHQTYLRYIVYLPNLRDR